MIIKNSLLILIFNLIAHFFNYLYHLVAAKFLTPADFGLLQSFVALNYFFAVLVLSYSLSIIKLINTTRQSLNQVLSSLQGLSIKLTLIVWFVFILSYPAIKSLLHLQNPLIFFIFSLQLLFAFIPTVYSAIFLAKLKFFNFSLLNLLSPALKLGFAFLFLILNFKVFGMVAALSLTAAISTFISLIWIKKHFKLKLKVNFGSLPASFYSFSQTTFISQLSLTSLYSTDIILARYYFPQTAGLYSTASLLARIIFFASASVLTVAFPVFTKGERRMKKDFILAFLLISLIGLGGLIAYSLFPEFFVKMLAASNYLPAAKLLPIFSLFMVIFSLFNLTTQFLLNVNLKLAAVITSLIAVFQIVLIVVNHSSFQAFVLNSLLASSLGLIFSLFFILKKDGK